LLSENANFDVNGFLLQGLLVMERGYIFTCMILSAMAACLINRKFGAATIWSLLAALLTLVGLIHTYQLQGNILDYLLIHQNPPEEVYTFRGYGILIGYLLLAMMFGVIWYFERKRTRAEDI
ncbi:MAG: NCS2 family permease, partial [Planctomycetaceae bacterium]|nr:NCS2 family permease [Planctomycetaceae bacterium]